MNDFADQEVLLFGHGFHYGLLAQQQFFGVKWVHGFNTSALGWHFTRHGLGQFDHRHGVIAALAKFRVTVLNSASRANFSNDRQIEAF